MARKLLCVFLGLSMLTAACGGDDDSGDSSSIVFPASGFLGRQVEVVLSGNDTSWAEGVAVDFGPGVTVDNITVVGPTTIIANLDIAFDATTGPRGVTVDSELFNDAFTVGSPLEVVSVTGTQAQGSIILVELNNLDTANPLDASGGFFNPFPNLSASLGTDAAVLIADATASTLILQVNTDVTASTEPRSLDVFSGPEDGPTTRYVLPAVLTLEARSAVSLNANGSESATVGGDLASHLYTVTTDELSLVELVASASDGEADPSMFVLDSTGSFSTGFVGGGSEVVFASDSDQHYVIIFEGTVTTGHMNTVSSTALSTAAVTESEDNNNDGDADALSLPAQVTASLSAATDEDWYAFSVSGDDAGKGLRLFTEPGDPGADPIVTIWPAGADFDNAEEQVARSDDFDFHEELTSPALAEGDYLIQVTWSEESEYNASSPQDDYVGYFWLVDLPPPAPRR